jgi:hypothetical protein
MTPARVLAAVALGACVPSLVVPPTRGATVSLDEVQVLGAAPGQYAITYRAAAGEANRLVARASVAGRRWTFRDTGARVVVGAHCVAHADAAVTCTAPEMASGRPAVTGVAIDLGDGDDSARIAGSRSATADVEAGAGDDVLRVTAGWVQASMGPGDDRARGDGDDLLGGGRRRGGLQVAGGPGADAIDAGPSADVGAEYLAAAEGVRVSTDGRADDGAPGERDDVGRAVRTIAGGAHDDVLDARHARARVTLRGNAGGDRLYAAPAGGGLEGATGDDILRGGPGRDLIGGDEGDDRLVGGAGDDVLSDGPGRNIATGGSGHDAYYVASDARDVIHAGDGARDTVDCALLPRRLEVDRADRLTHCAFPVAVVDEPRLDGRRRLHVALACPRLAPGGCRVTVRLIDTSPQPLAITRLSIAAGATARRAIPLGHRPRNLLFTAIVVNRRARSPASARTTVTSFQLGAD